MKVALVTGAYDARSVVATAQRCVNLYMEKNPEDVPYPFTHYPTPGLTYLGVAPLLAEVRGLYTASNNHLYGVVANKLYDISSAWVFTLVGTINTSSGPVSMKDNTLCMVLVDGTTDGWAIDLATNAFGAIVSTAWYGSTHVDYLDTFFIFNRLNTNQFYSSLSNVTFLDLLGGPILTASLTNAGSSYTNGTYSNVSLTGGNGSLATATIVVAGTVISTVTLVNGGQDYRAGDVLSANAADIGGTGSGFAWTVLTVGSSAFDPLYIAGKTGGNDLLVAAPVMHREISLIGVGTSEVWYDSGAADFPFQAMPGAFIEHGCQAVYSIAKYDLSLFWLAQDSSGNSFILEETGYKVRMISTRAIANEINSYAVKSDAIGFTYIQQGHAFYVLTFPTQSVTWVWDIVEQHWHQRQWNDSDGNAFRWRPNCVAIFNNKIVAGDFQNGQIYSIDLDNYQDAGNPIVRIRSFPYLENEGDRIIYRNLIAWMEVGAQLTPGTTDSANMTLRISNDYGVSFPIAIIQSMGDVGAYLTSIQFNRLGLARARVFEVSWSAPMKTALTGVFVEVIPTGS